MWKHFSEIIGLPFSLDLSLENVNMLQVGNLVSASWTWLLTYLRCWVCMNKMRILGSDKGFGLAFSSPGVTCCILNLLHLLMAKMYWYQLILTLRTCYRQYREHFNICLLANQRKIIFKENLANVDIFLISKRLYNVHNCL